VTGVLAAFAGVLGALVGSFLNVVIHRLPRGERFGMSRSHCPKCGALIRWFDNVPILSFLWLLGRCRSCRARISVRYPIVEIATATLFSLSFLRAVDLEWEPVLLGFATAAGFAAVVVAAAFIDLQHKILPDRLTLRAGPVFGLIASVGVPGIHGLSFFGVDLSGTMKPGLGSLVVGLLGAVAGGGVILLLRQVGTWIARREAMGLGDVKFMAMCGLLLGPGPVLMAIWAAILLAAVIGVAIWAITRSREIPFGPFLGLGALATLYAGDAIETLLLRDLPALLRGE